MKERGIIMSGDNPKLILEGRIRELFEQGRTHVEIAAEIGCSKFPVQKTLKRLGLKRPAARRKGVGSGANNPAWKGGRRKRSDGYIAVWTPQGEILEHRLIMSRHLGRPLLEAEIVHHKDENKENNALGNLLLCAQSEHIREHLPAMHVARYGT